MDGPVISNWKSLVIFLGDFFFFSSLKFQATFGTENFRKPEDHSVHTNTIEGSFLNVVKSFDVFKPNFRKFNYFICISIHKNHVEIFYFSGCEICCGRRLHFLQQGVPQSTDACLPLQGFFKCVFRFVKLFFSCAILGLLSRFMFKCNNCNETFPTSRGLRTHANYGK